MSDTILQVVSRLKVAKLLTASELSTLVDAVLTASQATPPEPGKYDAVLVPFMRMMERELHANAGKGDRPGWLSMPPQEAILEIHYHVAKLQKATKDGNLDGIQEYAPDVANMAMMLLDVCVGIRPLEEVPA